LLEAHPDLAIELCPMSTRGDQVLDRSLAEIGGKGLFLKELEQAIVDGRADFAVHSLKDVPARMPDGLVLAAWLPRADAADLWITRDGTSIDRLPPGSRVGSSSLRRIRQLQALRPDLEIVPLRGNVETRMQAVFDGRIDATVLAAAGLRRLGVEPETAIELSIDTWLPAPAQGVIAVECRTDDAELREILRGRVLRGHSGQGGGRTCRRRSLGCRLPYATGRLCRTGRRRVRTCGLDSVGSAAAASR
jgi:hydroxymethylbilane synthase